MLGGDVNEFVDRIYSCQDGDEHFLFDGKNLLQEYHISGKPMLEREII